MICPDIHPFSMGWRMGYGEGYKWDLLDWLKTLSEDDQKQYRKMFPPPTIWSRVWEGYWLDSDSEYCSHEQFYEKGIGNYGIEHWKEKGIPKYSKEWLLSNGDNVEFIFFWQPGDITFEPKCCFCQWQYSYFRDGTKKKYNCAEQYMMAEKARLFEDEKAEKLIMASADPKQMKAFGRMVKNFKENIWLKLRYSVVLHGNYFKFTQNEDMRNILLATEGKILVEASPLDKVWGIGYAEDNINAANPKNWRGSNLLGFALMEVRDELKRVYQNYEKVDWTQFDESN